LYTPGELAVVEPRDAELIAASWQQGMQPGDDALREQVAQWLESRAAAILEKRRQWLESPFAPECLTVHLSDLCHLNCNYCYTRNGDAWETGSGQTDRPIIDIGVVEAAAHLVAKDCAAKALPFHLVLHGGGEPTRHWDLVEKIEFRTRQIAAQNGLDWFGYIATNGLVSRRRAEWLATHFSRVGLSCDGPPYIQDRQRPLKAGRSTSQIVAQTAKIIVESGGRLEIRSTITPDSYLDQEIIVDYLCDELRASHIRFEPVYNSWRNGNQGFGAEQAAVFARHFLAAQRKAESRGSALSFSGVRLDEVHGPYCDVLRNVLRLKPDGTAGSCFLPARRHHLGHETLRIGSIDSATGCFRLDADRIATLRDSAARVPAICTNCINLYHCAQGCPEYCRPFRCETKAAFLQIEPQTNFRCLLHKRLAVAWILETAGRMVSNQADASVICSKVEDPPCRQLVAYLQPAQSRIDVNDIIAQFRAIEGKYDIARHRMPEPVWNQSGFTHDGSRAWQELLRAARGRNPQHPLSIYVHIPFCERRCGFCDCYSITLGKQRERKETRFLQALDMEINAWGRMDVLRHRPVTTIHFGGGTPNCINDTAFSSLIKQLRQTFNATSQTEWAVEITSSLLTSSKLKQLRQWGVSRLHVGVQSLDDSLRHKMGRQQPALVAAENIKQAMAQGFICTADIVYGFPGQTVQHLLDTMFALIDLGITGISIYRFNVSKRNRAFVSRIIESERDDLYDYALLQVAEQIAVKAGYTKKYYNHFASPEDKNLYFTYPQRGEDLLAMGPTADGVFLDYVYRHPGYGRYMKGVGAPSNPVSLEGGMHPPQLSGPACRITTQLMAGWLEPALFDDATWNTLLNHWIDSKFFQTSLNDTGLALRANGTWFICEMISQIKRRANQERLA
jgi:coproporphyrinogen III oxidase-like Fe-S oxidoreductase/sulfatase maturation enzyme AslB (radical SAM superfamily)